MAVGHDPLTISTFSVEAWDVYPDTSKGGKAEEV
jgi:hypothetical protein